MIDTLATLLELDAVVAEMNTPGTSLVTRDRHCVTASHYAAMLAFGIAADVLLDRDGSGNTTIAFGDAATPVQAPALPDGYITFGDDLTPLVNTVQQSIGHTIAVVPIGAPVRADGDVSAYDLTLDGVDEQGLYGRPFDKYGDPLMNVTVDRKWTDIARIHVY